MISVIVTVTVSVIIPCCSWNNPAAQCSPFQLVFPHSGPNPALSPLTREIKRPSERKTALPRSKAVNNPSIWCLENDLRSKREVTPA